MLSLRPMQPDEIILAHSEKYPLMQPRDVVKLCYQACFGAGHLLTDQNAALEWLQSEYSETEPDDGELFEPLPGGYTRLYLGAAKRQGIPSELVFALFRATAGMPPQNDAPALFRALLECVLTLAERGSFAFARDQLEFYLYSYLTDARVPPPASHSDIYRSAYSPHYRVVDARFVPLVELCKAINPLMHDAQNQKRTVIAFDGRCASGKTTAADLISRAFDAQIIHCDDFFLPPELRTPGRFAEPGGNIHYERFEEEVLAKLSIGEPFEYGVFDCSQGRITQTARVGSSKLVIVEGAYSMHPRFGQYYALSAFFDISPERQKARIIARDGEEAWQAFENRWIPLEETYISSSNADKRADIVIRT